MPTNELAPATGKGGWGTGLTRRPSRFSSAQLQIQDGCDVLQVLPGK